MAKDFTQPKLIVGEGKSDAIFFHKLVQARGLTGFVTTYPKSSTDEYAGGGWTFYGKYLLAIETDESFIENVKRIVITADNDEADSFERIQKQLESSGYKAPKASRKFMGTRGKQAEVSILMIPDDPCGCLESLCYEAARTKWPALNAPFDTYFSQTDAVNWGASKQAKMKMQCVLASTCKDRPDVRLRELWHQHANYQFSLADPVFDSVVDFLKSA